MSTLKVTRTYNVEISDEHLERVRKLGGPVLTELADAATRMADAGNLQGTLYLVKETDEDEPIWLGPGMFEGEHLAACDFDVEEIDASLEW